VEPTESPARIGEVDVVDATTGAMRRWIAAINGINGIDGTDALDAYPTMLAGTAAALLDGGADALSTSRALSGLHDALATRLIELAEDELGPPPCPYAWIALGSGGRMEQSLYTDQDHAIVYAEGEKAGTYFAAIATRVIDGHASAGVRRCPGGYMADRWHQSLPSWRSLFRQWLEHPEPQALVEAEVFLDFRRVRGELSLEPLDAVLRRSAGASRFLVGMARAAVRFGVPQRLVGPIRLRHGEVDLKRAGLSATVLLARLYALMAGSLARSTPDRLAGAASAGVLSHRAAANLVEAHRFLTELRLAAQLRQVAAGQAPTNRILLEDLTADERRQLRHSLRAVREVQRVTALRFRTDTVL
jgi:CBS domain-containing protein